MLPVESALSAHIRTCWERAKRAKVDIETEMVDALLQRTGEYDAKTKAEIQDIGGSNVFIGLTEVKCRAAEAWIDDVMLAADDKPWTLTPTPIPSLSPETMAEIEQAAMFDVERMEQIKKLAEEIAT